MPLHLGVAGYSKDLAYLLYKRLGAKLHPRRVVPQIRANGTRKRVAAHPRLRKALQHATGDRLTVFYVPTVAAVYDRSGTPTKQVYGMDENWDIQLPEKQLTEICARQGIPQISPTSPPSKGSRGFVGAAIAHEDQPV